MVASASSLSPPALVPDFGGSVLAPAPDFGPPPLRRAKEGEQDEDEEAVFMREVSFDAGIFIGLDMGGSLVKLTFLEPDHSHPRRPGEIAQAINLTDTYGKGGVRHSHLAYEDTRLGGIVHFITWPSDQTEAAVAFIKEQGLHEQVKRVVTAGGGGHKYAQLFRDELGVELVPADELGVVIRGVSWLIEQQQNEIYEVMPSSCGSTATREYWQPAPLFPYLLVNIGTGVSIVKVRSHNSFQRVSGTAMGGGTYWGLCQLLTDCQSWEEAMELASAGNAQEVNLMVEDIYGGDYTLPTGAVLRGSLTASFFGKIRHKCEADKKSLLAALTTMVSQNICQVAYLNARIHQTDRVLFTGNYLRRNKLAEQTMAYSFKRASLANPGGEDMRALFLAHEGYFGALGSLLEMQVAEEDSPLPLLPSTDIEWKRDTTWVDETGCCLGDLQATWQFIDADDSVQVLMRTASGHMFESHGEYAVAKEAEKPGMAEASVWADSVLFRTSLAAALQTFCSALVQTDVPALLMELFGNDPTLYARFASRQSSFEKVFDLILVAASCALSDRFGRKPLQMFTGGLLGVLWNLLCFALPTPGQAAPLQGRIRKNRYSTPLTVASVMVMKLLHSASTSAFLAVNGSAMSDVCHESPEKVAAASAAAQSYVGLAVITAPLVAVQLRKLHRRAPFVVCAALCAANWLQVCRLPETLPKKERSERVAWSRALNPLASATVLLRQGHAPRLRTLGVAYSLVSLVRCADTVLQAFTRKALGWGRDESARLLSFWGATVFLGSQVLRRGLQRLGPDLAVRAGAVALAAQELCKSLARAWWHLPGALVLGLPSAGLEPALKALIAQEARRYTELRAGEVQAALKTQQALTLAALGSPLVGTVFARWASLEPTPRFAWHYLVCAAAALTSGALHAAVANGGCGSNGKCGHV